MFYCCFFSCSFAGLYIRAASSDRRETFTHDWKCVHLDNVSLTIKGLPKNIKHFEGNWFKDKISDRRETLPSDGRTLKILWAHNSVRFWTAWYFD